MGENRYFMTVTIKEKEFNDIMQRLKAAQDEIFTCYRELEELGILNVEKENAATKE